MEERKVAPVILDMQVKFSREVRNRERVLVKTWCYDYNAVLGKIDQVLLNEKGEEACTAKHTFGLFDLQARKLVTPSEGWIKAFGLAD